MSRLAVLRPAHPTGAHAIVGSPPPPPERAASGEPVADRDLGRSPCRRSIPETTLSVHPLALGCSSFGWSVGGEASRRILDEHAALGGNFIDTADSYSAGRSETMIGSWLRMRGGRETTVIATKIGRNLDNPGLSPRSIMGAVDASLRRLGTDYIDLLYFHGDDVHIPLEESLGAMATIMQSGKVRYLGASNFSPERLIEARVLAANGLPRFSALETQYSLVRRRDFEASLSLVTQAQGMAVMPYFPLAHGFLAGRYRSKADIGTDTRSQRAAVYLNRKNLRLLGLLDRIAAEHDVPPATIALAWLLARPGVLAPVAGASHADQVEALVAAAGLYLARSDVLDLDHLSK
ncbi:aldo/keto reductase [Cryobacterium psychrophilum]|uniref:Aldo/keto reductase n=1 Tax=Cryobacterium psychrophilum TaxID=41988 RepID=A0A4Y8KUZ4_9MICO|nr:aldo/keto reductase [Cryobacterium psychrophilum]TDW29037.1 aryl-alcohol dehydrogenase-like predicted oxidoreductase [Cryobacterium psychrophilum]TFD79748.1 aldo/keto reductase [Cryobacterium psychrophilum]